MKLTVSSDTMPGNMFLFNLDTVEFRQLTDTLNPEIDPNDLVASTVVRFAARDGMTIPGPLYKPIGASAENKVPVMLWIHGGPGGQTRAGYSGEKQFLINHGYALFAVNNRGSSGYGKSFLAADDRRHGREPLWDCVDAKEYLKTLDWVDPDRIGIMGGSYGGYMVLAALAFEPEEFACGVDIFGVANWLLTLENIPPYWESFRKALYAEIGHPVEDAEFLRATSPVFHGDKITRPLLILQGANDPRVLQRESDDMVAAIKAGGGTVDYVVFEDEGHGFRKSANRVEGFNTTLEFLDTHLKGATRSPLKKERGGHSVGRPARQIQPTSIPYWRTASSRKTLLGIEVTRVPLLDQRVNRSDTRQDAFACRGSRWSPPPRIFSAHKNPR